LREKETDTHTECGKEERRREREIETSKFFYLTLKIERRKLKKFKDSYEKVRKKERKK
jgi:hypothetical protein